MLHTLVSFPKRSYLLFIVITLFVFALVAASAIYGVLFAFRALNGVLSQQNEPEIPVTYFNIEKLQLIKDKLR